MQLFDRLFIFFTTQKAIKKTSLPSWKKFTLLNPFGELSNGVLLNFYPPLEGITEFLAKVEP